MKKVRIALLTNNDDDIYCFRKELIETIVDNGYEILISCPYGEKLDLIQNISYQYDNPSIDRRGTNVLSDLRLLFHYYQLFKKYRPAIVLTYTAKPNVYGSMAAYMLKIPVINNVTGFGSVLKTSVLKRQFIMNLFKFAYTKSACIMFQNETNLNLALKMGMVKSDYQLIPGSGVNTNRYPLQSYPEGGNGIEGETIVFNYIGRILHDKGVDDYIEAAKIIKMKYPKTEFNMLGFIEPTEMHYHKELEELMRRNIVIYRGNQKDVKPYIKRSHAIIHPSTYGEGMSNVLLENAASGRPIITTDNPGCQETLEDNISGYIYHGGNVQELVKSIEKFLHLRNEEREIMGKRGRTRVKENFSRSIVVDAYLNKIRNLVKA